IERGKCQRIPQHLANPGGLSVAYQPTLDRLARRRRNFSRARLERSLCEAWTRLSFVLSLSKGKAKRRSHPHCREAIVPAERVPFEHAGQQMQWCRQPRTDEARSPPGAIDHRDAELRLDSHIAGGADVLQKRERV